jgi:hypothetical protein
MTDIIRYDIAPKEIYSDGFDFDLPTNEPQATYTNKDTRQQLVSASTAVITLDTGLPTWNNFEISSDQALTVTFYDAAVPSATFTGTTYVNMLTTASDKIVKVINASGVDATVSWKVYG